MLQEPGIIIPSFSVQHFQLSWFASSDLFFVEGPSHVNNRLIGVHTFTRVRVHSHVYPPIEFSTADCAN